MSLNIDRQLLEAILETISDDVEAFEAIRDQEGVIIDFSHLLEYRTLFGGEKEAQNKLTWKEQKEIFDLFVKVVETGEPVDTIIQYPEEDQQKWCRIKAKKFNTGLVVIREDVSMTKQSEEKIMQLNTALFSKNRELEALSSELKTFNSIAANDYNETLRSLYSSMEFLVQHDGRNLTDAGKANIRRAQASIQKMKLLTDDIIAFSKIHSGEQKAAVDLNETLIIVLSGLDEKIKAENGLVRSEKLPVISGYSPLLSLLFYHLINNAIKFRKEKLAPVIDIKHRVEKGDDIEHSAALKGTVYNIVSVIDNGIGFPPEEGEKIFTIFYRLQEKGKHKGSGIGLAICKKIMDLHGGFIASECTPECTTFRCYFPIQKSN